MNSTVYCKYEYYYVFLRNKMFQQESTIKTIVVKKFEVSLQAERNYKRTAVIHNELWYRCTLLQLWYWISDRVSKLSLMKQSIKQEHSGDSLPKSLINFLTHFRTTSCMNDKNISTDVRHGHKFYTVKNSVLGMLNQAPPIEPNHGFSSPWQFTISTKNSIRI